MMEAKPPAHSSHGRTRAALRRRMAPLLETELPLEGVVFRSVGLRYATGEDFLGGHGASLYGGRWNPPGLRAVYASGSPITAVKEAYQSFLHYGFQPQTLKARVLVALRFHLHRVLDLQSAEVLMQLRVGPAALVAEGWQEAIGKGEAVLTQDLGQLACELGWEALCVPSAQDPEGWNLVLFPQTLLPESWVEVVDKESLPRHPVLT